MSRYIINLIISDMNVKYRVIDSYTDSVMYESKKREPADQLLDWLNRQVDLVEDDDPFG